jgi:hypothetical protein
MKNIIQYLFVTLAGAVLLISCKKYKDDYYGPYLGMAPNDFTASTLTVSNSNPNFISGPVHFKSTFNYNVRWTLTMIGQTSGAIKSITDFSTELNATNSKWDGSTDTLKQFRKNETVNVTLSVLGWKDTLHTSLIIGGEKDRGYVLGSFEGISVDGAGNFTDNSYYWFSGFESVAEKDFCNSILDPSAPAGAYSFRLAGHDANKSYYIGKIGVSAPGAPTGVFNFGITSPSDCYFNVYVKGCGITPDKDYKLVIQTYEDDNGSGVTYPSNEDTYSYPISLKYIGWKLFRIPYSSFTLENAVPANIYQSHSPDKINNIGLFIGANTSAGLSASAVIDVRIDHFSVTSNGPMIP